MQSNEKDNTHDGSALYIQYCIHLPITLLFISIQRETIIRLKEKLNSETFETIENTFNMIYHSVELTHGVLHGFHTCNGMRKKGIQLLCYYISVLCDINGGRKFQLLFGHLHFSIVSFFSIRFPVFFPFIFYVFIWSKRKQSLLGDCDSHCYRLWSPYAVLLFIFTCLINILV